mmetsp:Transcript_41347/g.89543  ORF Transcript_41347/g.89543 Transcript_41347/m.89543 type:complete len:206 (-) Transcript_41347:457-1074(-)
MNGKRGLTQKRVRSVSCALREETTLSTGSSPAKPKSLPVGRETCASSSRSSVPNTSASVMAPSDVTFFGLASPNSQSLTVVSLAPESSSLPWFNKKMRRTSPWWPVILRKMASAVTSHTIMMLSLPPENMMVPSCPQARQLTSPLCPSRLPARLTFVVLSSMDRCDKSTLSPDASHSLITLSRPAVARVLVAGQNDMQSTAALWA